MDLSEALTASILSTLARPCTPSLMPTPTEPDVGAAALRSVAFARLATVMPMCAVAAPSATETGVGRPPIVPAGQALDGKQGQVEEIKFLSSGTEVVMAAGNPFD